MLDFVLAELRDAQASIDGSPGSFYDLAAAAGKYLLITGRRPRFKKSWAKKAARAFKSRLRLILECAQSLRGDGRPLRGRGFRPLDSRRADGRLGGPADCGPPLPPSARDDQPFHRG